MPMIEYVCEECGARSEHLQRPKPYKAVWGRDGKMDVKRGVEETWPEVACEAEGCSGQAKPIPSVTNAYLVSNGDQICGWSRPGMTGVDYRNGPDGAPASHLNDMFNRPAYVD